MAENLVAPVVRQRWPIAVAVVVVLAVVAGLTVWRISSTVRAATSTPRPR
jgi:hypothetical protein